MKDAKLSASEVDNMEEGNGDADFRCSSLFIIIIKEHVKVM